MESVASWGREKMLSYVYLVCLCVCMFLYVLSRSVVSDSATPWTVAHQTPLSMGFSRQEYWSGLPFPTPGDLLGPETEPTSLVSCVSCTGRQILYH